MSLDDTRKAAIEAYLGVTGMAINDLEFAFYADMLANGLVPSASLNGSPTTLFAGTGTLAAITAALPPASTTQYTQALCTDFTNLPYNVRVVNSTWQPVDAYINIFGIGTKGIVIGGNGGSWARDIAGLVTVTWAAHGLPATEFNGGIAYLTQGTLSTGTTNITSGWGFTNFTYVDANTFTVQTNVLEVATGNLGTNTAETDLPTLCTIPDDYWYPYALTACQVFVRGKSSGSNKTGKLYLGDFLLASANYTATAGVNSWASLSAGSVNILSNTTLVAASNTAFTTTYTGRGIKASGTCASSSDWVCIQARVGQLTGLAV